MQAMTRRVVSLSMGIVGKALSSTRCQERHRRTPCISTIRERRMTGQLSNLRMQQRPVCGICIWDIHVFAKTRDGKCMTCPQFCGKFNSDPEYYTFGHMSRHRDGPGDLRRSNGGSPRSSQVTCTQHKAAQTGRLLNQWLFVICKWRLLVQQHLSMIPYPDRPAYAWKSCRMTIRAVCPHERPTHGICSFPWLPALYPTHYER